jgi:N-acylneuraminate cytidylyltransferase
MKKNCIAFIPARGGSKRLENKNILDFNGIPLIAHSILAAKNSGLFDRTIVSTDYSDIANVASDYGAEIIMRPKEISGDHAKTESAAEHVLKSLKESGYTCDILATLQPTNPLRRKGLMKECLDYFLRNFELDSLITVSKTHNKYGIIKDGKYKTENYLPGQRSQDLNDRFFENGLLYLSKSEMILNYGTLFGESIGAYVMDDILSTIDIDTLEEFQIAEFLHEKFKSHLE